MHIDGQCWRSVVEQPNEEDWHSWEAQISSRSRLSIYGHMIDGKGEFQGKHTIWNPSDDSVKSMALGFMDADTLEGAMQELIGKIRKPIKAKTLNGKDAGTWPATD
ncbi:hypothetical protein [uncultured Paraglaciecola sp.]|uniref:hypothetical protein n=1 Tax=uncultured Paraglaciecola sp. TaxID=1765024 RepID=UPI0026383B48|nr:hypothetical protein [uncultured Paraglaciecola sp.]